MTDNVINFPPSRMVTDLPSKEFLEKVAEENPKCVFVITWDDTATTLETANVRYNCNKADNFAIMYFIGLFMHKMYNGDFD